MPSACREALTVSVRVRLYRGLLGVGVSTDDVIVAIHEGLVALSGDLGLFAGGGREVADRSAVASGPANTSNSIL